MAEEDEDIFERQEDTSFNRYQSMKTKEKEGQITPKGEVSEPEPMEESKQTLHEENEESAQISERGADDAPILGPIAHDEDEPIGMESEAQSHRSQGSDIDLGGEEEGSLLNESERSGTSLIQGVKPERVPHITREEKDKLFDKPEYPEVDTIFQEDDFAEYKPLLPGKDPETRLDVGHPNYETVITRKGQIESAKDEVADKVIDPYEEEFNKEVEDELLLVGSIQNDDLIEEQRKAEEEKARQIQEDNKKFAKDQQNMTRNEEDTKIYLQDWSSRRVLEIDRKEGEFNKGIITKKHAIVQRFKETEKVLHNTLIEHKYESVSRFGEISVDSKAQRYNLVGKNQIKKGEGKKASIRRQPINVHLELVRALKDKIPKGRYSVLVTLLDRIGGNPLNYQEKKKVRGWKRVTKPHLHGGQYYHNELRFQETLKVLAPTEDEMRPSMVLLFEMFMLKSREFTQDQVLGWGVFPLVNSQFQLNQGKYKIPLLWGPVNKDLDKFRMIENIYRQNLDKWVANIYFEMSLMKEFGKYAVQLMIDDTALNSDDDDDDQDVFVRDPGGKKEMFMIRVKDERTAEPRRKDSDIEGLPPPPSDTNYMKLEHFDDEDDEELDTQQQKDAIVADLLKDIETEESADENEKTKKRYRGITVADDYDNYHFNLTKSDVQQRDVTFQKIKYIFDEALSDLGFHNANGADFWISVIVLLFALWLRMYTHYLGSYIFLQICGIEVYKFDPKVYIIELEFPYSRVGYELGNVICANLFNTLLFAILMLFCWIFQKWANGLPKIFSKFIASFGIAVIVDFFLILLVDIIIQNFEGEFFRLYIIYDKSDDNGAVGIVLVLFIYFSLFVLNSFNFYNYLVFLHMEGRIIDIFTRLTGEITHFFVPHDMEVSARYLKWVLAKIKRERAANLKNPKQISITFHTVTDKNHPKFNEETTYISIYKRREDNKLTLFRHFVRNPDGSICELEESITFSVDDYPLLEKWPKITRRLLVTESEAESVHTQMSEAFAQGGAPMRQPSTFAPSPPSGPSLPVPVRQTLDTSGPIQEESKGDEEVILIGGGDEDDI